MTGVAIRRARPSDVDAIVELLGDAEVEPYLAAVGRRTREELLAEIRDGEADPEAGGRFVIEVGGEPAGTMMFERVNRRSRIARLGGLAVAPGFRGRKVADQAARLFQRHLFELGFHRLELEIYGFNERAVAHAERSGFVREGVRRRAYRRHGEWYDSVVFGLLREEWLLREHVARFNEGVRSGDFEPMLAEFADDAELAFEGVPVGPFRGREAIAAAYREQPPDDEIELLGAEERGDGTVAGPYAWRRQPGVAAGEMRLTREGGKITRLVVTFSGSSRARTIAGMELIHTCYRITDIDRAVAFYTALGFEERGRMPIREEAINVFMGLPGDADRLELTYNFGVDSYELGTGYGHVAVTVDDLDGTLERLTGQGIEPERPPYQVREGGGRLCFVRDPDGYRIELIERSS